MRGRQCPNRTPSFRDWNSVSIYWDDKISVEKLSFLLACSIRNVYCTFHRDRYILVPAGCLVWWRHRLGGDMRENKAGQWADRITQKAYTPMKDSYALRPLTTAGLCYANKHQFFQLALDTSNHCLPLGPTPLVTRCIMSDQSSVFCFLAHLLQGTLLWGILFLI